MNGADTPQVNVQGIAVPPFIYGTAWKEERTALLTRTALDQGFRAIDTANQRRHYFEAGVGEAVAAFVQAGVVSRSDLFLQTKFTHLPGHDHRLPYRADAPLSQKVVQSFELSLEHLRSTYVNSYLLHGPSAARGLAPEDWEVWRAMEALHRQRKVALIGISNVSVDQLASLLHDCTVRPAFVQNRCYARTGWDLDVRTLCRASDILYQGFSLLTANQQEMRHPKLLQIARSSSRTPAQVVFRFALQVGMLPLTGTSSSAHMREDLACLDFELTSKDVETLEHLTLG